MLLFRVFNIVVTLLALNLSMSSADPGIGEDIYPPQNVPPSKDDYEKYNTFPRYKIRPRKGEKLWISKARCGLTTYNEQQITETRNRACYHLPTNKPDYWRMSALEYRPGNSLKYGVPGPFYIYPMKRQPDLSKAYKFRGNDMIVLNRWCQVLGIVSKNTMMFRLLSGHSKLYFGRFKKEQIQKGSPYIDCVLTKNNNVVPKKIVNT